MWSLQQVLSDGLELLHAVGSHSLLPVGVTTPFTYWAIPQGLLSYLRATGTESPACSEAALEAARKHLLKHQGRHGHR